MGLTHVWRGHSHVGVTHVWRGHSRVGLTHVWRGHSRVGVTHVWRGHSRVGVTHVWDEPPKSNSSLLDILSSGVLNCRLECVVVISSHSRATKFQFSGQYSSFSLYRKYQNVLLHYKSIRFITQYQVDGMFMIIDFDEPVNVPILQRKLRPHLVYKVKHKHTVLRYLISIRKLDHMIIKMTCSSTVRYVVHDGPGLFSDILHLSDNYTVTSTFQCLVLLLTLDKTMLPKMYFVYVSKKKPPSIKTTINNTSNNVFHFPNNKCNRVLCVLTANADPGYQVNITATLVKSTNDYNYNCLYTGLVTGERLASKYRESKIVCDSSYDGQVISFYSKNTSLTVVVYWYQQYSEISSTIIISQTKCKTVSIDLCYLHTLHLLSKRKSHMYLHDVSIISGTDLNLQNDGTLVYKVMERECSILQFLSIPTTFKNTYSILHKITSEQRDNVVNMDKINLYETCQIVLISRYEMNIQIRLPQIETDFTILETKLLKKKFENISEPKIPRILFKLPSYKKIISGTAIYEDTSFILNRKNFPSNSWIELIIRGPNQTPSTKYNFKKIGVDFKLNDDGRKIYSKYILPFTDTLQIIFLLKSNTKTVDPNVSVIVKITTNVEVESISRAFRIKRGEFMNFPQCQSYQSLAIIKSPLLLRLSI